MPDLRAILADTRPLQNPDFRRLWWANIITVIGAQLTVVAVPSQIYAITGSSSYVGLTGLFGLVPLVVFGLWGGALADAVDRAKLLRFTTLGLILATALFWVQAAMGLNNVWVLLSLFSVQQAMFAVNQPTRSSIIPRLIPLEQLPAANSLSMTVMMFGGIAGPLIGGALIPITGYPLLYALDAVSMLGTLWAVWKLPSLPPLTATAGAPGLGSVVEGLKYLAGHRIVMMSFVVDLIAMIAGMPRALFPQLAHENFHGPAEGGLAFALLFAAIPIGSVLGGVLSGWISRVQRTGLAVLVSIAVWGVAVVGAGLSAWAGWLAACVAFLAAGGAADMASAAFRSAILQGAAADEVRGRLQGVFIVVVAGGPRIADVLHGFAASSLGAPGATTVGGLLVVAGIAACAVGVPQFTRFRLND